MEPKYFIINNIGLLGFVFDREDGHKIILMVEKEIDLQYGMEFRDKSGNYINDPEVEDIIKNFVFWKE